MGDAWALLRAAIDRLNLLVHQVDELNSRIQGLEQQLRDAQGR